VAALIVLGVGAAWRSADVKRLALYVVASAALMAIPVYLTGDAAVMVIRNRPGTSLISIGDHQESANRAIIALEVAGAAAVAGLWRFRRRDLPRWFVVAMFALGLLAMGLLIRTAYIGGHITHPETMPGFTVS